MKIIIALATAVLFSTAAHAQLSLSGAATPAQIGPTGVSPGTYGPCSNLKINAGGQVTSAANATCPGGGSGNLYPAVRVDWTGSDWETVVNGTQISHSGDCVAQLNAAFAANVPTNYGGVTLYGEGDVHQCTGTNETIIVPAGFHLSFYPFNVVLNITNTNGANGVQMDTLRYGRWDARGMDYVYSGSGSFYYINPHTAVDGSGPCGSAANAAFWALDYEYDLGTMRAAGGTPYAGLTISPNGCSLGGSMQVSSWVDNVVDITAIEGAGIMSYGIRFNSPAVSGQNGGENQFRFGNIEGAAVNEISIGANSTLDAALGTNFYRGNIAHTATTAYLQGVQDSASWDRFMLTSANSYNSGSSTVWGFYWGTYAQGNYVCTMQAFGWGPGNTGLHGGPGDVPANNNAVKVGGC